MKSQYVSGSLRETVQSGTISGAKVMTRRLRFIGRFREEQWLIDLLEGIPVDVVYEPSISDVKDGDILVVGRLRVITNDVIQCIRRTPNIGMIHLSDEFIFDTYEKYNGFDWVIRNYLVRLIRHPQVFTIPLGYTNGTPTGSRLVPGSERPYLWVYAGSCVSSRSAMLKLLSRYTPFHVVAYDPRAGDRGQLSAENYHDLLRSAKFAPCPMGNVVLESFRIYEALEAGAIPIVEDRPWLRYFERLFGEHPLPVVYRWKQAGRLMETWAARPSFLDERQAEITEFWERKKNDIKKLLWHLIMKQTGNKISGIGATSAFKLRRLVELAMHQSITSLAFRLRRVRRKK